MSRLGFGVASLDLVRRSDQRALWDGRTGSYHPLDSHCMKPDSVGTVDVLVAVLAPVEDQAALFEKL